MAARYDRIGDTIDHTRRADPRIADCLMSRLGTAPGASVLDVACGTGNCTSGLAERGLAMVGTEARTEHLLLDLVSDRSVP